MKKDYIPTQKELEYAQMLSNAAFEAMEDRAEELEFNERISDIIDDYQEIIMHLGYLTFSKRFDEMCDYIQELWPTILEMSKMSQELADLVVISYKQAIAEEHGPSMNNLGALYYNGELVEQDYKKAAELYEMAGANGEIQGYVNLGYIWEYGRMGEKDPHKAYQCYALACALEEHFEALYKLGDMYSKGMGVKKNMITAITLWQKSLSVSEGLPQECHAALRLGKIIVDPEKARKLGQPYEPLLALNFFLKAEIGFRVEIKNGLTYYSKQLREAMEGQEKARLALIGID